MIILSTIAQFKIPGQGGTQVELPVPTGIPQQLQGGLQDSGKAILQTGLNLFFIAAVLLAVVFILIGGIQWITSSGDPGKISSAKKKILYSIIGFVVVAGAFLIFNLLTGLLGKSLNDALTP